MASFDIESTVDEQLLDNAVNNVKKEILNRFDFQGSATVVELDKKALKITFLTENDMKLRQMEDSLISKLMKQKLDPQCLDATKAFYASGNMVKKEIMVKSGIEKDTAKKIVKMIKAQKLKVQAQIMDDKLRVTGKKIDHLQEVIAFLRSSDLDIPLQFVNMKS
ncbi:UNVERIFIED_CONTAM: hypothetical protein GTU68_029129 [Idotea baltica]|nr:hypothetical protein [Idotea baltica]